MKSNVFLKCGLGLLASVVSWQAIAAQKEIPLPRSVEGDKGSYFLLDAKRSGSKVVAVNKRIGVDSVGFTRTETDCSTMLMRVYGYSEESPSKIINQPGKWFELVPGSSKSDLALHLCKR